MNRPTLFALLAACLLALAPSSLSATVLSSGSPDHVGFGNTITVSDGESAGDLVCMFCTVRIHGNVSGDVVTLFGDVQVDRDRAISGDMVVVGGNLSLPDQARIDGSLVVFGGDFTQPSTATVHGDRVLFTGTGWLIVLLLPLLIPIGVVWLIVYIVRRSRYQFPAYPGGRF